MQAVAIKSVDDNDFGLWLPLWQGYQQFYEVSIPEAVTHKTWERLLDPAEPMHAVLAMSDGQALGLAHFIYHGSTWATDDYCYLQDLFIADNARGRGIGRALIEHVYAEAERHGASRVYWVTHESNHDAMQLYDRIADRLPYLQYRRSFT